MKTIQQLISYLIIFQLCFACNGGGGSSSGVVQTGGDSGGPSETISVQGSFAKVFHSLGGLLLDSAIAQDGTIEILDLTNPKLPVSLGTFDVDDESKGFSLKIKSSAIKGKVISLDYEGGTGSTIGKRSMILEVEDNPSDVVIDEMNADSTLQSQVLLTRLQDEEVTLSDVKKRFKELHQHKDKILQQIKELSLSSPELNDYIKGPNNSLAGAIAAAWVAGIDGDDASKIAALEKFNYLASNDAPDLVRKTSLICDETIAKFSSQIEGSFKVLVSAVTVELQEKFGSKEFEIGIGANSDEVNKMIANAIEKLQTESMSFKEIQIMAIHVLNEKSSFTAECKIKSRSDYFAVDKIQSYVPSDGATFREMTNIFWNIHQDIKNSGKAKIEAEVLSGNLKQDAANTILYNELINELKVLNLAYDKLNEKYNTSEYNIDITKLRSLSCSDSGTMDEFEKSLGDVESSTYQSYVDKFGNLDNEDFYVQIDLLKQTVDSQRNICKVYFR